MNWFHEPSAFALAGLAAGPIAAMSESGVARVALVCHFVAVGDHPGRGARRLASERSRAVPGRPTIAAAGTRR